MALRRSLVLAGAGRVGPRSAAASVSVLTRGGHGGSTLDPPMHRLPLPNKPLHEEDELIWNDGVAPETALDFDAPHVSKGAGLAWWLGGFAFFYSIYLFAKATGQPAKKMSGERDFPEETKTTALGNHGLY